MISIEDIQSFFEGVAAADTGVIKLNVNYDNDIARIDFGEDNTAEITMADGKVFYISDITFNASHQITSMVITHNGVSKQCNITYDENGYLTKVGSVEVANVELLNIEDLLLQTKTVTPSREVQNVTADENYDALNMVIVEPYNAILQDKSVTPTDVVQTINADPGYDGLRTVTVGTGGGGRERELTQAEYDALTEEEKMDGTTYYITDADNVISIELNDLTDVRVSTVESGQILKYDGTKWINGEEEDPNVDRLTNGDIDYIINTIS